MININFVPDDYVKNNESHRTNLMYLLLFGAVMIVLVGSFTAVKIRQRALDAEEKLTNSKLIQARQAIQQFEELQTKRKAMMKTALTTAELLEPVPRSVVLASLTNNLPGGVSLLNVNIRQKEARIPQTGAKTSKYNAAKAANKRNRSEMSREKLLETHIDIEGIAPSDLQVAAYIDQLTSSHLLDNVSLVESKERSKNSHADNSSVAGFRQFKLKAMLRKEARLTSEDINRIRSGHSGRAFN